MPFRDVVRNDQGLVGVGIDLTEACNRGCPTCFVNHTPREMDFAVFRQIADEASNIGFPEFYILGGEPTLHPQIIDCLDYTRDRFKIVILVTNMDRLADAAFCRLVEKTGCIIAGQRHTLSLTDTDEKMEYLLTGGNHLLTSHRAWTNVERMFPSERVCVQCCITRPVVESKTIFDVFRWCRRQKYEPVMEFTKEGSGFKRGCSMDVNPKVMARVLEEFQRIDRDEFGLSGANIISPQAYGRTCHMQENSIHFRTDGTAIPCVGFPGLTYGNITAGFDGILGNPLRKHIADPYSWIYGYCSEECLYFDVCTGGCRGSAFDMAGCYRASFYYCPNIPRDHLLLADMIPPTCNGCLLAGNRTCHPQR